MVAYESDDEYKLEKISIAGVSDIPKLEAWLETNSTAAMDSKSRLTFLLKEYRKWEKIYGRARKQQNRLKKKLTNLKKVQSEDFELNEWYELWTGHYFLPERATPAGRVYGFSIYKSHMWDDKGQDRIEIWCATKDFVDSGRMKDASRLEVLIEAGNIEDIVKLCENLPKGHTRSYREVDGEYVFLKEIDY